MLGIRGEGKISSVSKQELNQVLIPDKSQKNKYSNSQEG